MRLFNRSYGPRLGTILGVCLSLLCLSAGTAQAADFPARNVQYIIPFVPGGESDISARLQQKYFEEITGKQLIIQYMAGGGGAVAWSQLNGMSADGYTIMGTNLPHIIVKPMDKSAGFKTEDLKDFYYFHYSPDALVVPTDSPYKTVDDFIAAAKATPGAVMLSGSGTQSSNDVAHALFDKMAGITTTYIPFKGTGEAVTALLGKQVQASWGYSTVAANHEDKTRMLAVATEERMERFPDVPTFKELGYDLVSGAYRGMAVPAKTPDETAQKLADIFGQINQNADFRKQMEDLGFVLIDEPFKQVPAFLAKQKESYLPVMKELNAGK